MPGPLEPGTVRGARLLLLSPSSREERIGAILSVAEHMELAAGACFQDVFAESMALEPFRLR